MTTELLTHYYFCSFIAFLLADQGYDVWLGNVRGNSYCRSHVKLSSRSRDFWQFR